MKKVEPAVPDPAPVPESLPEPAVDPLIPPIEPSKPAAASILPSEQQQQEPAVNEPAVPEKSSPFVRTSDRFYTNLRFQKPSVAEPVEPAGPSNPQPVMETKSAVKSRYTKAKPILKVNKPKVCGFHIYNCS